MSNIMEAMDAMLGWDVPTVTNTIQGDMSVFEYGGGVDLPPVVCPLCGKPIAAGESVKHGVSTDEIGSMSLGFYSVIKEALVHALCAIVPSSREEQEGLGGNYAPA